MKKQSLALHFYKSVSLDLREEFQSVQSHNSTEKCGEYDEGAVWVNTGTLAENRTMFNILSIFIIFVLYKNNTKIIRKENT